MNQSTRPHACALREGRASLPGQIYHVTTTTRDRIPFFSTLTTARTVIGVMRELEERQDATTLCFMLMPDHLHWLMALGENRTLSDVVRAMKAISSKRCGKKLWQKGFHDHALRRDEDVKGVARYIVYNPVKAGLVDKVGEYPHWDAIWV